MYENNLNQIGPLNIEDAKPSIPADELVGFPTGNPSPDPGPAIDHATMAIPSLESPNPEDNHRNNPDDDPDSPEGGDNIMPIPKVDTVPDAIGMPAENAQDLLPAANDPPLLLPPPSEEGADNQVTQQPAENNGLQNEYSFLVLLLVSASLFHTPNGVSYASVKVGQRIENYPINSREFRKYLSKAHYDLTKTPLKAREYREIVAILDAKACYDSPEYPVHLRIAEHEGVIYYDLANYKGEIVKTVDPDWEVISSQDCPIKFIRTTRMLPMAAPVKGGSIDQLWDILNISNEDRMLIIAWVMSTMQPDGPYPILIIQGEQGSGKSWISRILRDLVDPSFPALASAPSNERDLAIAATKTRILAFDNMSSIGNPFSDALCRRGTGGGLTKRTLYTDNEECVYELKGPTILNGITALSDRNDLMDRAIIINPPSIASENRLPESELISRWKEVISGVLGALFSAVSCALKNRNKVQLENLPRMADFVCWLAAAEGSLPYSSEDIIEAYLKNRTDIIEDAIYSDPLAHAIRMLVNHSGEFTGTPTELLTTLNKTVSEAMRRQRAWPSSPNVMSNRMKRVATFLRERGIDIQFSKSGTRRISIRLGHCAEDCNDADLALGMSEGISQSMNDFYANTIQAAEALPLETAKMAKSTMGGAA
ncbi:MAG: hypothetical protein AB1545_14020 [Thermodesulfobacteriota bacterium]